MVGPDYANMQKTHGSCTVFDECAAEAWAVLKVAVHRLKVVFRGQQKLGAARTSVGIKLENE
jgi:hypothetical protein